MEKIESKNGVNNNSLDSFLNKINNTFSKENWIENNFYKIPEITYTYIKLESGEILNQTLFCDIGELNEDEYKKSDNKSELIIKASENFKNKVDIKINEIDGLIKELENITTDNNIEEAKKNIILGGLKETKIFLELSLEGLDFEKEKAIIGLYFKGDTEKKKKSVFYIDSDVREKKLEKINSINEKLYGKKLSENTEYIEGNIDYLFSLYENYNKIENLDEERKLTNDEKERYKNYLKKLQNLSPEYKYKQREKPKSVINSDELKNTKLNKIEFKNILNHSLKATDKETKNMPHKVEFDKNVSTFTDTPTGLLYPDNEIHETKNLFDLFRLNLHENEQHGVAQVSHETLVGNIRGEKNLELVEGMAVLSEKLFEFGENIYKEIGKDGEKIKIIDIKKLEYVQSFPKSIMEEILTDEEFYDFLQLHNKIEPDKMSPLDRYLRHKRTGFQKKDTVYTTGMIKAAKYFNSIILGNSSGDFSDLYLGKVGFNDLVKIRLLKEKSEDNLPKNLFFTERLYFETIYSGEQKDFNKYLINKYPFLEKQIINDKITQTTYGFKRQLLGAIGNVEDIIKINRVKHTQAGYSSIVIPIILDRTRKRSKMILKAA